MTLSITDSWHGTTVLVHLDGRLDTQTSKAFEDHLAKHLADGHASMVIDLEKVDYVSSYGLRVFLMTAKKLRGAKDTFVLQGLTPNVGKIFHISGFDKILTIRAAPLASHDIPRGQIP